MTMGEISMNGCKLLRNYDPEMPSAIEFRRLYSRLRYKLEGKPLSPLMVTSSKHEEGKTTTAAFLAVTVARQEGGRVLLVDMDLHRPQVHHMFSLPLDPGVSEIFQGRETIERATRETGLPGLHVVTSGSMVRHPSALFEPERIREFLREVSSRFDLVILDAPPLLPVTDTMVLSMEVAAVLFVIMAGKTPRDVVTRGKEILRDVNAPLAGVVINNSKGVLPYYYNYKYYGYGKPKPPKP
ncbi:MAG: CpsD/CapB family tyrosine-protein kinase [Candidatus Eisenbacteria bacterium]